MILGMPKLPKFQSLITFLVVNIFSWNFIFKEYKLICWDPVILRKFVKKLCLLNLLIWKRTMRILKVLLLKLMANFQFFQTIFISNFCIWKDKKTTANFLIVDIEMASFNASHCKIRINGTEAVLWSKMPIFKRAYHNLIALPHLCQSHSF